MICKECGAYNPDHATYCKVCAANLKGDTASDAVETPEEEQQQTKRFSRPSWVVPEQVEEAEQQVSDTLEEAAEEAEEAAQDVAEAEIPEEQPSEESVPAWTPLQSRRSSSADQIVSESEEQQPSDFEEENDGVYNEEEALEEEENSFEYEPTPPKRKPQKKKNNTMFTILLIAIIVVIVAVLVIGGIWLFKKLKCDKDETAADPNKSSGEVINQNDPDDTDQPSDPGDISTSTPAPTPVPEADVKNAVLQEIKDDSGKDVLSITFVVPAKSSLVIDFPNQEDYRYDNNEDKDIQRRVKIPAEIFYKNAPLDEETVEFTPDIRVTKEDGTVYKVACASFKRTFPKLNITVTEPLPNDDGIIMAPEGNVVEIRGKVDPAPDPVPDAITINGVGTTVYEGGSFVYEYKLADDIGEDEFEEVTIVARKNNYVIDSKTITIYAYKFIPEKMVLEVKTEPKNLRTDSKTGKVTVSGVTLPGATLTAVSDNASSVLCGTVTVDNDGNFSFPITTESGFFGMSKITLSAEKEGAESATVQFTITKGFESRDAFKKYYQNAKKYLEINIKVNNKTYRISDLLNNQEEYANNSYGIHFAASVVEAIDVNGEMILKMTVLKTNETIYVHNLSEKWTPDQNIGGKYNIWGNFIGTYGDTGCCEFLGWYAKNIK